jgi:hypothetical protein
MAGDILGDILVIIAGMSVVQTTHLKTINGNLVGSLLLMALVVNS